MPVSKQGSGYRCGNSGKIYYGKGAKEKAEAQGRAAHAGRYWNKTPQGESK